MAHLLNSDCNIHAYETSGYVIINLQGRHANLTIDKLHKKVFTLKGHKCGNQLRMSHRVSLIELDSQHLHKTQQ